MFIFLLALGDPGEEGTEHDTEPPHHAPASRLGRFHDRERFGANSAHFRSRS
jgi:hypothetical protein